MILLQAVLIIFAVFMTYVARIHQRKHNITKLEYFLWIALWIGLSVLTLWPQTIISIAQTVHVDRVFDLLVIFALMIIMLITFYNRLLYHQLRGKLERLTRERAIETAKDK